MRVGDPQAPEDARLLEIADQLRAEWRMIEEVTLRPRPDGDGFNATIRLNAILVSGAAEQQGPNRCAACAATARSRRLAALSACVERLNERLPPAEAIRDFRVIG